MVLATPLTKKRLQDSTAFPRQNTTARCNPVIQPGRVKTLQTARHGAAFGIMGAEHQPCHPGMHNRADTHQAGLQGDVEGGIGKPVIAQ